MLAGVVYKISAYRSVEPYWYEVDPYESPYYASWVYSETWVGIYEGYLYFQYED